MGFTAEVHRQIKELAKKQGYGHEGDAFAHWALQNLFDFEEDEAYQYTRVGRLRNDKGIDAFWSDDEDKIYIVQSGFAKRSKKFGPDAVRKMREGYNCLLNAEPREVTNESLRDAIYEFREKVSQGKGGKFFLVIWGSLTEEGEKEFRLFLSSLPVGLTAEVLDRAKIEELYYTSTKILPKVEIELKDKEYFETADGQSIVCTATASSFVSFMRDRFAARPYFADNPRYYLLGTNPVNKGIQRTLQSEGERGKFWFYNNGVVAVAEDFHLKKERTPLILEISGLRVVNGCQTLLTMIENKNYLKNTYFLFTVIKTKDDVLKRNVSQFRNRQTAIKGRDLMSQDDKQQQLHKDFKSDPPWYYEIQNGMWKNMPEAEKRKYAQNDDFRYIPNQKAAQALYAFTGHPREAKNEAKKLFVTHADGGYYDTVDLFENFRTREEILVVWQMWRIVQQKVRERSNVTSQEGESEYIEYADYHILGLIWKMLGRKYNEDFNRDIALRIIERSESIANALFPVALVAIRNIADKYKKEEEEAKRGPAFRKYFVRPSAWSDATKELGNLLLLEAYKKQYEDAFKLT